MAPFDKNPDDDVTAEDPFGGQEPPKATPDVPPARAKRGRKTAEKATESVKKASTLTADAIEKGATGLFSRLGLTGYAYALHKQDNTLMYDSLVVAENADDLGKAIAIMSERSPKFKKTVERVAAATEYTGIGSVVMSVVVPIAWNHNLIPFKDVIGQWISHPGVKQFSDEDRKAAEAFVNTMTGGDNAADEQPEEFVQGSNHARSADSLV